MTEPRDYQTEGSSQTVVSVDQASAVSVRRIDKRAVKEKDIESSITRESSAIYLTRSRSRTDIHDPPKMRTCSDNV